MSPGPADPAASASRPEPSSEPGPGPAAAPFAEDRVEEDAALALEVARERSGPRAQWPLVLVLAGLVVSLGIVATDHFRRGSVLFAGFVVLAALLRALLTDQQAGWLAVRSRTIDLLVLGFLAVSLSVFSAIVPPPS